jgi:hypothetical protein
VEIHERDHKVERDYLVYVPYNAFASLILQTEGLIRKLGMSNTLIRAGQVDKHAYNC